MVNAMKKRIISLLLTLVLLVSPILTACGGASGGSEGISLVVILGYHANASKPTREMLEQSGLPTLIQHAIDYYEDSEGYCHAKANIKFILCDGKPEAIELKQNGEPIVMHYEAGNFDVLEEDMRYLSQDILDALQSGELMADDEEVDLITALSMAGDLLRMDPGAQNHIMVLDTGLNTAGFLKMQETVTLQNLQKIGNAGAAENAAEDACQKEAAAFVKNMASGSIANLENMYVTFYGLGNVDGVTQSVIADQLVKDSLIHFWTAYFEKCGAKLVVDMNFTVNQQGTPMIHNSDCTAYPYVSNIPFKLSENKHTGIAESGPVEDEPLVFNENTLTFREGSEQFRNRDIAVAEILNRKDYFERVLAQDPNAIFYVVGSIAKIEPGRTQENGTLSLDRAREVAKIMVEKCGIPADQIKLIPAGLTRLEWRNHEEFPNGQKTADTSDNMQRNRVVAIVPSIFTDPMNELRGGNDDKINLLEWAVPYGG